MNYSGINKGFFVPQAEFCKKQYNKVNLLSIDILYYYNLKGIIFLSSLGIYINLSFIVLSLKISEKKSVISGA